MSELDITRIRRETRGCETILHFNNAGASFVPAPVADYLYSFLHDEEMHGAYETAEERILEIENFYFAAAKLIGATPQEIAFVENATRAWDMVFYSLPLKAGDRILTALSDYGSNIIACLHRAQSIGAELVVVPNDEHGQIDLDALRKCINSRTKLISISHIPTGGGLVNPAAEVGVIAKAHGIPYLLDACQSIGQIPLDVQSLGCDFLSASGRKYLRGPRGTGLLYVKREWINQLTPPLLDQFAAELVDEKKFIIRSDARRFENWERFVAGQATLGAAIDYALNLGMTQINQRVFCLAEQLRESLSNIPAIELTDEGVVKCGIVTFRHAGYDAVKIKKVLSALNINISVSSGSGMKLSYLARGLDSVVRASVHYFNTEFEVAEFCEKLRQL